MSEYLNVIVTFKGKELERYSFSKPEIVIGRGSAADVLLDNAGVSREHARVTNNEEGLRITDLQSNNGTFLNGATIQSSLLQPGDTLRIGKFALDIERSAAPLAPFEPLPGSAAPRSAASEAGARAGGARAAEAIGPQHTVLVSPGEKAKVLTDKAPPQTPAAPAVRESGAMLPFVAGVAVGVILAWLFL